MGSSSAAGDETAAADNGAAAVVTLEQLWESMGNADPVQRGLGYMGLVLADEDLVTTEELTTDEIATSVSEKETIVNDSASYSEGDDSDAPQPVTSVAAVDTLLV